MVLHKLLNFCQNLAGRVKLKGLNYYLSASDSVPLENSDTSDATNDTSDTNITDYAYIFEGTEDIFLDSVDAFIEDLAELMESAFTNWLKTYAEVMESNNYLTESSRFDGFLKEFLGSEGIGLYHCQRTIEGLHSLVKPKVNKISTLRQGLIANLKAQLSYN